MINLTCQKTHILAWLNLDNTLSLKINGIKYLAHSKVDKRGERYWKCDGLSPAPSTPPTPQATEKLREEIEVILKKPLNEQTVEDRKKWAKYVEQEKAQEQINQSQKVADQLSQKITKSINQHESTSPN
jgi:hypothetical protein